mgnify:FL=1|jgi:hypothetical protein
MPWVRFTTAMDWKPQPMVTIAYLPGMVKNVTRRCADAAVTRGHAVRLRKQTKTMKPVDEDQGEV